MSRRPVSTDTAPAPSGGYSQAIACNGMLYLAGQGPFAPDHSQVSGGLEAQVRQVFANLAAVCAAGGTSLDRAVHVGVYLSDLVHFEEMDRVYRELFPEPRPARTTIQSDLVGFDVEADAVVALGE